MATQNERGLKIRVKFIPVQRPYICSIKGPCEILSPYNYNNEHFPSSHNSQSSLISFYGENGILKPLYFLYHCKVKKQFDQKKQLCWRLISLNKLGAIWRNKLGNLNRHLNPARAPRAPGWTAYATLQTEVILPQLGFWEDGFSNSCHS